MYSWYIFFKWLNWATFSSFKGEPPDHVVHIWHFKEKKEKTVCISFHFNISLVLVKTKTIFNDNSQSSQDFQAVTDQFCKWLAWNWSWRFTTKIVPAKLFSYTATSGTSSPWQIDCIRHFNVSHCNMNCWRCSTFMIY